MAEWTTITPEQFQACLGDLRELHRAGKLRKVKGVAGKRSDEQNDLSHVWYAQMAREDKQEDELGHKCYCKLHHGVPILRAEDAEFKEFYDGALKGLTYAQKLAAMKFLPVTSLMNTSQLSAYLKAVQDDYATRQIYLEFPQERRFG